MWNPWFIIFLFVICKICNEIQYIHCYLLDDRLAKPGWEAGAQQLEEGWTVLLLAQRHRQVRQQKGKEKPQRFENLKRIRLFFFWIYNDRKRVWRDIDGCLARQNGLEELLLEVLGEGVDDVLQGLCVVQRPHQLRHNINELQAGIYQWYYSTILKPTLKRHEEISQVKC